MTETDVVPTLERQLCDRPLDDDAWRVYADLLEGRGDPTAALIHRGLAADHAYAMDAGAALGPLSEIDVRVSWRGRSQYDPDDLWSLPSRGLEVTVTLGTMAQQERCARLIAGAAPTLPRLWAFLREVDLHVCDGFDASLVDALRRLPLQQLKIRMAVHKDRERLRLDELPAVRALHLDRLPVAQELPGGVTLPLRTLLFDAERDDLAFLARLPELERLSVSGNHAIHPDLVALAGCDRLRALRLNNFILREDRSRLAHLARLPLRHLELSSVWGADLAELATCETLERLVVSWTDEPLDLAPLAALPKLRDVRLRNCSEAFSVAPLVGLAALEHLEVHDCPEVEGLHAVQRAHPGLDLDFYVEVRE